MNSNIENRENRVNEFISSLNKVANAKKDFDSIQNTPEVKLRKLNSEMKTAKGDCLDMIFAKLYKDTLPIDSSKKSCGICELKPEIHDFISMRNNDQGTELYVREAIRHTDSSKLKKIMEAAENFCKEKYNKISSNLNNLDYNDIQINFSDADIDQINKITSDLEFDDLSDIISKNVKDTIQNEIDKSKREKEFNDRLENELVNDPNVTDDASLESALDKIHATTESTVYQPSLFEAIMLGKSSVATESTSTDTVFTEAVEEFTKLNIIKALRLESFNLNSVKKLANSYL